MAVTRALLLGVRPQAWVEWTQAVRHFGFAMWVPAANKPPNRRQAA